MAGEFAKLENDNISFIFTINPSVLTGVSGQKQVKIDMVGRNGSIVQFLGQKSQTTDIKGTLYGGYQYSTKKTLLKSEMINSLIKISNTPTAFDFAGVFINQVKAEKVTVSNFTYGELAGKPNTFTYSMTLTQYRAFNSPTVNVVRLGDESFVDTLNEAFDRKRRE